MLVVSLTRRYDLFTKFSLSFDVILCDELCEVRDTLRFFTHEEKRGFSGRITQVKQNGGEGFQGRNAEAERTDKVPFNYFSPDDTKETPQFTQMEMHRPELNPKLSHLHTFKCTKSI